MTLTTNTNKQEFLFGFLFWSCMAMLLLGLSLPAFGKENKLSVAGFKALPEDMTAMMSDTEFYDQNGERAALIKIESSNNGFTFDVGTLGVAKVEWQNDRHPAEIWLYVPEKVRFIDIQHPTLGKTGRFHFDISVEKGRTYSLELSGDDVETIVIDHNRQRKLTVKTEPANADLSINGVLVSTVEPGVFSVPLSFGKHTYQVSAPRYHSLKNTLVVNEETDSVINIRLPQAFGYLSLTGNEKELKGATVFIDGENVGMLPFAESKEIDSGNHNLKITKKLYFPFEQKFTVSDSVTVALQPVLMPNNATISISVPDDKNAVIYVDNEELSAGSWKGQLESGRHIIEARRPSHAATRMEIDVVKDNDQGYTLEAPKPIYGTLSVTSSPAGAEVYIDGGKQSLGKTPFTAPQTLIGPHKVTLRLKGHRDETLSYDIREGETESKHAALLGVCTATINSTPYGYLYIDGNYVGTTPHRLDIRQGDYQVEVRRDGYLTNSKRRTLNANTGDIYIKLRRNFTKPNEFYLQGGYTLAGDGLISVGAGFYFKNVNLEGNYLMGMKESETIYWTSPDTDSEPDAATYKPSGANVKAGYGFSLFGRLRLTPQLGVQFITFKEQSSGYETIADRMKAVSFIGGARISFAITKFVSVSVSPEWKMALGKSEGFKAVSAISKSIKGYAEGIGVNCSLNLFF